MEQQQLGVTAGWHSSSAQPRSEDARFVEHEDVTAREIRDDIGKLPVFGAAGSEDQQTAAVAARSWLLRDEFLVELEVEGGRAAIQPS